MLRLRQIALVAPECRAAAQDLAAVLDLAVCHVDPAVGKWGLENALLPVGSQFLEVVAPVREGTAGGRYLERRGGAGGYMVICQCDDQAPFQARAQALGVRTAFSYEREDYRCWQMHPADTGGSFFEIDRVPGDDAPDGAWPPAGPDWAATRASRRVSGIAAAEIQSASPRTVAARWSAIAGVDLREGEGALELPLENAVLRFVEARDGRGEGLGGIDLVACDRQAVLRAAAARGGAIDAERPTLCGLRLRLLPSPA